GEFGASDELLEAGRAVERLAHQQERGSGGEKLDAFRDRAAGPGRPAVARIESSRHAHGGGLHALSIAGFSVLESVRSDTWLCRRRRAPTRHQSAIDLR